MPNAPFDEAKKMPGPAPIYGSNVPSGTRPTRLKVHAVTMSYEPGASPAGTPLILIFCCLTRGFEVNTCVSNPSHLTEGKKYPIRPPYSKALFKLRSERLFPPKPPVPLMFEKSFGNVAPSSAATYHSASAVADSSRAKLSAPTNAAECLTIPSPPERGLG